MTRRSFLPAAGLDGVWTARGGKLNAFAVRLRDGGLCLYSPVAGLEAAARDGFADLGGVSALLAPNHYHNKGLAGHASAFPDAVPTCSAKAAPRLAKITGLAFDPVDALASRLAERQRLLQPAGLKTGEVWIEIETPSQVAWIVADAFTAPLHAPGVYAEAPAMLGAFPRLGVEDASAFKDWTSAELSRARPTALLSCHGSPVTAADLNERLARLLAKAF
ncbi:MAG: hypothetical protein AAFU61_01185 [Pseudomonadota bacterium]